MPPELRCQATKDDGTPCEAPETLVDPETGLCPSHDPENREKVRENARKGGEAAARRLEGKGLSPDELDPLEDHADAKRALDQVRRAVLTGRISDKVAHAATRAVSEWVKAHEGELTARVVDDLEEEVERLQSELEGRPRLKREK